MFKSVRWKSERNKIKAEFKLQFHATQVSQLGVDALALAVVPGDVGKPTVRLEKATVRDGSCRWENQVLITVKILKEPKSGKINEKIYYFLVSSGSSNPSVIGEVSIDLAEYAEATKPSFVTLPLKSSTSTAVLHVSIQRMQANTEQREVEECEDTSIKSPDMSLKTYLSHSDTDESVTSNHNKDSSIGNTPKTFERNGYQRGSCGSDITLSSSESSSGLDTPRELGMRNNNIDQDHTSFPSSLIHTSVPNRSTDRVSENSFNGNKRPQSEWSSLGSNHGASTDELSDNGLHVEQEVQRASDIDIEKLKAELILVARRADVSELELHALRKNIIKESKRGQDLTREIVSLKEERDALEAECERLNALQLLQLAGKKFGNKLKLEGGGDIQALLEETRRELKDEKDLNRDLQFKLQKTEESKNKLILTVKGLEERLTQKNGETSDLSKKSKTKENAEEDEEQKELEYLLKEHISADETYRLEQKVIDLCGEIEIYRRDKDELEMQMEQLALDYEILKQKHHDISRKLDQSNLQEQLKMQYECSYTSANVNELETQLENLERELKQEARDSSDSLVNMKELKSHITRLEEDIEKQTQRFEFELEAVMGAKVEQEQRAIRAEESLRKIKQENANRAERLQKEFRSISKQMIYAFDRNEKMAAKAVAEARDLHVQRSQLEDTIHRTKVELQSLRDDYEARISELSKQVDVRTSQFEAILLELDVKSQEIQILKSEIERLTTENNGLSHKVDQAENLKFEIEQMKTSAKKAKMLIQKGNVERKDLVNGGRSEVTPNGGLPEEQWSDGSTKRNEEISSQKEPKPVDDNRDHSSDVLTEFESLRERNISMEIELKEMQERYSEISLKFAEVEGERQKLVMSLRSIKNSRK